MRTFVKILFLVFLAMSVESASHHRRHQSHDGTEHEHDHSPTSSPSPVAPGSPSGDGNESDDGGVAWPEPVEVNNFEVPDAFRGDGEADEEPSPARHHGKSKHKSRGH